MGCFPTCFGHSKHKQTIKRVQHQTLPSRDVLLQEAAVMLGASTQCCINEEEIASVIKHVLQSNAEPGGCCQGSYDKEAGVGDNEGNGDVNYKADKGNEDEAFVQDPAANNGPGDFLAIDKECPLAPTAAKLEEKGNEDANKIEKGKSVEALKLDPTANNGCKDLLAIDEECVLAATAVKLEEEVNLEEDNAVRDYSSCPVQMESSESLFSLSIDSRKHVSAAEMEDKEVSSALKPMMSSSCEDKENENVNLEGKCSAPSGKAALVKQSGSKLNKVAMDTSLSSWLIGSEKAPDTSNGSSPESEKNYGGRQILGVISLHQS